MSLSGITKFLNSYGTISPVAAIVLFIIIPALPLLLFIIPWCFLKGTYNLTKYSI